MKMFVMGGAFLVQGAILALPSHSGSIKAAHLEDGSAKGYEQFFVTQILKL